MSEQSTLSVKVRDRMKVVVWVLLILGLWVASSRPMVFVDDGPYRVGDEFTFRKGEPVRWSCDQEMRIHLGVEPLDPEATRAGIGIFCPSGEWGRTRAATPDTYAIELYPQDEGQDPGVIRVQRQVVWWRAGIGRLWDR